MCVILSDVQHPQKARPVSLQTCVTLLLLAQGLRFKASTRKECEKLAADYQGFEAECNEVGDILCKVGERAH